MVIINYYLYMQSEQKVYQIKNQQFPFGLMDLELYNFKKIFVTKRYIYRTEEEYQDLKFKILKLKGISHKNTINLRSIQQNHGSISLLYQYVPVSLEDSFSENPEQTVKEIHRQFIELAIFLAKSCINTSFNPNRCGVVINQSQSLVKYYLPLNEFTITSDRNALERSVQMFNVQSMHYLDNLVTQGMNSTINENCSQRTFKNRIKLFPQKTHKDRRDSQPTGFYQTDRKLCNYPTKQSQIRKLSTLSRQLSEISMIHKRRGNTNRTCGGSFNTFKQTLKSHVDTSTGQISSTRSNQSNHLKRCLSQNQMYSKSREMNVIIQRSKKALCNLQNLKSRLASYKGFFDIIISLKKQ